MKTRFILSLLLVPITIISCSTSPSTKISDRAREKYDSVTSLAYDYKMFPEEIAMEYLRLGEDDFDRIYDGKRVLTAGRIKNLLFFDEDGDIVNADDSFFSISEVLIELFSWWRDSENEPWEESEFKCEFTADDDNDLDEFTEQLRVGDEVVIRGFLYGPNALEECYLLYYGSNQ
jgi:hypothetical protein